MLAKLYFNVRMIHKGMRGV